MFKELSINNEFVLSSDVSLAAKGLYVLLLSLQEDQGFLKRDLTDYNKNGRVAISTAWKELQDNGFIATRIVYTRGDGKRGINTWEHIITDGREA